MNSQPSILLSSLRSRQGERGTYECLQEYCRNKEALLATCDPDRGKAKEKVLSIIFGCKRADVPEFFQKLGEEVRNTAVVLKKAWCEDRNGYQDADK